MGDIKRQIRTITFGWTYLKSIILAFSGGIGSGKTTLSKEVSTLLNWKRISFGDYVRAVAIERGIDNNSREKLQELGESLIEKGWDAFCNGLLKKYQWKSDECLVIDGIRHKEAIDTLRKITFPSKVFLIFISLDFKNRQQRLLENGNKQINDLRRFDSHSTETQVSSVLSQTSDLILDGNMGIDELKNKVFNFVQPYL